MLPVPAGTEEGYCLLGGKRGVGVNYANKCSDTNLDGDSVKEKLAEGGIVHMVEVVVAAAGAFLLPRSLP